MPAAAIDLFSQVFAICKGQIEAPATLSSLTKD